MRDNSSAAEVNIHLRARARDRLLIDQAAELVGANRSQFMLSSALNAARAVLLDQTTIHADVATFNKIMDWMDAAATPEEIAGMRRLLSAKAPWPGG
jgi:uncharacterized protein (DUF1778 family)